MSVVVAAVSAGAYVVAGEVALTYIAYAGIATAVVGALTKDKNLIEIGGKMSLVGGVGSMAASALEGGAAATATDAAATNAAGTGAATDAAATGAATNAAGTGATTSTAAMSPEAEQFAAQMGGSGAGVNATATPMGSTIDASGAVMPQGSTMPIGSGTDGVSASANPTATSPQTDMAGQNTQNVSNVAANNVGQNAQNVANNQTWNDTYQNGINKGLSPTDAKINADAIHGYYNPGLQLSGKQVLLSQMGLGAINGWNQADIANKNRDQKQQEIDQHSYGSSGRYYGIINRAKAKG